MKVSTIFKRFLFIINYQKISLFKNSLAFIILGLTDITGPFNAGVSHKGFKRF